MVRRNLLLILLIGLLAALIWVDARPQRSTPVVIAAPNAFTGPVNGGCYAQTPSQCRIHVDSWQPISIAPGEKLLAFELQANGQPLYHFRTDVSNPPTGDYLTSLVAQDFAIQCGSTYSLTLLVEDSASGGLQAAGSTGEFSCPLLETPTSTPTATHTPTHTPRVTPTVTPTHTPRVTPTQGPTSTQTPESLYLPHIER